MGEDEKGGTRCCRNCKWHEQYSWVCCNGDSGDYGLDNFRKVLEDYRDKNGLEKEG